MPHYTVNKDAVDHARKRIRDGKVDVNTPWSDAAPSASEANKEIDKDSYEEFARWHLAVDKDAGEGTKGRYRFPYGDFHKVNRAALIHAKQRAAQNGHTAIEKAADELLEYLDEHVSA